jgi:hypothetical protein
MRKYCIIPTTEIDKIDYTNLSIADSEGLIFSMGGDRVIIKWDNETPSFLEEIIDKSTEYSNEEILLILDTLEWKAEPIIPTNQNGR